MATSSASDERGNLVDITLCSPLSLTVERSTETMYSTRSNENHKRKLGSGANAGVGLMIGDTNGSLPSPPNTGLVLRATRG
jgi:hypothetical protein